MSEPDPNIPVQPADPASEPPVADVAASVDATPPADVSAGADVPPDVPDAGPADDVPTEPDVDPAAEPTAPSVPRRPPVSSVAMAPDSPARALVTAPDDRPLEQRLREALARWIDSHSHGEHEDRVRALVTEWLGL